jgi:uncharacterized protein with PQ loop repeat
MNDIFGWVGGTLALIYNIPQIYKNYITKSVDDLSEFSLILRFLSYSLFLVHVWRRQDHASFYTNSIGLLQLFLLLLQFRLYKKTIENVNGQKAEPEPQP